MFHSFIYLFLYIFIPIFIREACMRKKEKRKKCKSMVAECTECGQDICCSKGVRISNEQMNR